MVSVHSQTALWSIGICCWQMQGLRLQPRPHTTLVLTEMHIEIEQVSYWHRPLPAKRFCFYWRICLQKAARERLTSVNLSRISTNAHSMLWLQRLVQRVVGLNPISKGIESVIAGFQIRIARWIAREPRKSQKEGQECQEEVKELPLRASSKIPIKNNGFKT